MDTHIHEALDIQKGEKGGYESSQELSKTFSERLTKIFNDHFDINQALLLRWGSFGRGELSPMSDIDIILLVDRGVEDFRIEDFIRSAKEAFPKNKLDLLKAYDIETLEENGSIDGTDRQALMFASSICGSSKIHRSFKQTQDRFIAETHENIREMIHTWVNSETVSQNLYPGDSNIKFSRGGLRQNNFVFVITKLFFDHANEVHTTKDSIEMLVRHGVLSEEDGQGYEIALEELITLRNFAHSVKNDDYDSIDGELLAALAEHNDSTIDRERDQIGVLLHKTKHYEETITEIVMELMRSSDAYATIMEPVELLLRNEPTNHDAEENILESGDELLSIMLAHRTSDPEILESLRRKNLTNWYILYGIANNINATEMTLDALVRCPSGTAPEIQSLYSSFAWRNIVLYVAKNHSTGVDTLLYIINRPDIRPMDREAAEHTLRSKNP